MSSFVENVRLDTRETRILDSSVTSIDYVGENVTEDQYQGFDGDRMRFKVKKVRDSREIDREQRVSEIFKVQ